MSRSRLPPVERSIVDGFSDLEIRNDRAAYRSAAGSEPAVNLIDWDFVIGFEPIQFSTPQGDGGQCFTCRSETYRLLDEGAIRLPIDGKDVEKRLKSSLGVKNAYYAYADIESVCKSGLYRPHDILRIFPWISASRILKRHYSSVCHQAWVAARPLVCGCYFGPSGDVVNSRTLESSWIADPTFKSSSSGKTHCRSPEARIRRAARRRNVTRLVSPCVQASRPVAENLVPCGAYIKLKFKYLPPIGRFSTCSSRRSQRRAHRALKQMGICVPTSFTESGEAVYPFKGCNT